MNRLVNIIGLVVLCGILLKLSYVFVYLFGELDDNSFISKITGVTFAFASIYFVIKVQHTWLKAVMVGLDVSTILYFYLHEKMNIPIDFASVIVAAYSGLIIFYLGRIVSEKLNSVDEPLTDRIRFLENRLRTVDETRRLETDITKYKRRIKDSRSEETKETHRQALQELEKKYADLTNKTRYDEATTI
jgi:hypothetical protein